MSGKDRRATFYDSIAEDFDSVMNGYEVEKRLGIIFEQLLPDDLRDKRLLDVGCGTGLFTQHAALRGARVWALDIGGRLLRRVALRVPEAHLVQGDLQALGLANERFDVVLCTEAIEHTADPRLSVAELVRVLKPRGVLVLTVPNRVWRFSVPVANVLGVRPYHGYENWVGWHALAGWLAHMGMRVERRLGFNLLPLFYPAFHPLLDFADRRLGVLQPLMVNVGIRAVKSDGEPVPDTSV